MLNFLLHIVQNVTTRVAAILFMATMLVGHAYGQDQTVVVGSSYNYSTTQNASTGSSTFNWNITGGSNGTNFSYSTADHDNSIAVSWLQSGTYTVSVQEVSQEGCASGNITNYTVAVVPNNAHIAFASASSNDCSGSAGANLTLNLAFSGNIVYPVVVTYTLTVGATTTSHSRTINSGTSISLGSEDDILVNTTTLDVPKTITITNATSHGAAMIIDAQNTYIYTVWATPVTEPITY
ncbi:MAG TPA: hypothetical protein VIO15_00325 [Bacteroidales bacterium]